MLFTGKGCYKCVIWTLVMLISLSISSLSALAYDAWQPDNEPAEIQALDSIIDEFEMMVDRAKAANAAHPSFLSDLESVVDRLRKQRNIIADASSSSYAGYSDGYTSMASSYGEPKELTGPDVRYLGVSEDKIGTWSNCSPDGGNDGHFQVLMYLPKEVGIDNIRLHRSNKEGERLDRWWYSHNSDSWVLGVFRDGEMLNPNRDEFLGRFSGWILFDIYGAVQGPCFNEGEYLLLEMTTSEGELIKLFRIGDIEKGFSPP